MLFRLLWGFVGTRHARFSAFVFSPATVLAYTRDLLRGQARRYFGHNPLGGAMVVALLIMLTLATFTGLIAYGAGEQAGGPLAPWLGRADPWAAEAFEEIHEFSANATLALVALHIAGVIVSSLLHRENLVRAMFTGRKPPDFGLRNTHFPCPKTAPKLDLSAEFVSHWRSAAQ